MSTQKGNKRKTTEQGVLRSRIREYDKPHKGNETELKKDNGSENR